MSDQPTQTVRPVIVRGWPAQAETAVVDPDIAATLASFTLGARADEGDGYLSIASDPTQPFELRAQDALERTERLQEDLRYLLVSHGVEVGETIALSDTGEGRTDAAQVLAKHEIELADTDPKNIRRLVERLHKLPVDNLYALLCDWIETVEHTGVGSGREIEDSFLWSAHPERRFAYRNRVASSDLIEEILGEREPSAASPAERSFELFRKEADPLLNRYSFGATLRWIYFSRTEFASDPSAAVVPAALLHMTA
jgi:hypothetical protein